MTSDTLPPDAPRVNSTPPMKTPLILTAVVRAAEERDRMQRGFHRRTKIQPAAAARKEKSA